MHGNIRRTESPTKSLLKNLPHAVRIWNRSIAVMLIKNDLKVTGFGD